MMKIRNPRRLAAAVVFLIVFTVIARRLGYNIGGRTVVRCRQGHLFTTIWIPGFSLKSIRLGWFRLQRCPVGHQWSLVSPVRDADLTAMERVLAERNRDRQIP